MTHQARSLPLIWAGLRPSFFLASAADESAPDMPQAVRTHSVRKHGAELSLANAVSMNVALRYLALRRPRSA